MIPNWKGENNITTKTPTVLVTFFTLLTPFMNYLLQTPSHYMADFKHGGGEGMTSAMISKIVRMLLPAHPVEKTTIETEE